MELIMRLLLAFVLLLFGLVPSHAATGLSSPVMTNFYQPHFIVVPNAPPTQVIKSRIFGPSTNIFNLTTNIYNDSYTTYSNSYIVYTNATIIGGGSTVIFTNSTIIYTNSTIIINGQTNDLTQLWRTNASGLYFPAITNTATIVVGQSAQAWWVPTLADGFVSVHNASVGDSQFNSLAIAAIDNVLQENYGQFTSTLGSGAAPAGAMQLLAATNWQNPSAPFSKFSVALQPAYGEVLLDLMNNGVHEFAVSNQVTSVQALQLTPLTNVALALGVNQINVQSNSYIALSAVNADPTTTEAQLSTGLRDGMLLLLQNIGALSGFTLYNGSALYDDITKFVTLSGGNWATTNYGDGLLLIGGLNGWSEVGRFTQNTNVITGAQLWELVSDHMRTVPDTLDDWQFRYGGVPQLTISTNGGISVGTNSLTISGYSDTGRRYLNLADISKGDPESWEVWTGSYMDGADTANGYSFLDIYGGTNTAHLILNSQGTSGAGGYISLGTTSIDEGETTFSMIVSNISVMGMRPTAIEGQAQAYYFDTLHPFTVSNIFAIKNAGTNQLSFGPDARITFGEGGTNVLYREPLVGTDLVYTNGYQYPNLKVYGSEGLPAYFGLTPGSYGTFAQASGPKGVALGWDTGLLAMGSSNVWGSTPFNLGAVTVPFADFHADGKTYVYGFNPHSGVDYSRLAISHSGTNGAVVFDSQSAGTAGVSRPFQFTNAPVMLPYVTKVQKTALTPLEGEIVFQTDNTPGLRVYQSGAWVMISTVADP